MDHHLPQQVGEESNSNNNNNQHDPTDDDTVADANTDFYHFVRFHLPKVELHAHLNGCIPVQLLQELAHERGVTLNSKYFRVLPSSRADAAAAATPHHQLLTPTPPDMYNLHPRSLQDCFDMFAELPAVVNDLTALRRITTAALEAFARDGVAYLELRSTPKRLLYHYNDSKRSNTSNLLLCTKLEYCEAILQVMHDFEMQESQRYEQELLTQKDDDVDNNDSNSINNKTAYKQLPRLPLVCRLLVSIDRSQSLHEAHENVDLAIALHSSSGGSRVVGMDLGGNPTRQDFRTFGPCFQRARQHGLKVTLHCGEIPCDNDESVVAYAEAEAMLDFGPDRLGHAVLLLPVLLDKLERLQIPVETCPTSNVMTLELHHHHHDPQQQQQHQQENGVKHERHGDLVHGLQQHPSLRRWLFPDNSNNNNRDNRYPLVVCTDDPGVFDTTATQELWLLATAFHLSPRQLARLVADSVAHAFCDEATRLLLQTRVRERLRAWLLPQYD